MKPITAGLDEIPAAGYCRLGIDCFAMGVLTDAFRVSGGELTRHGRFFADLEFSTVHGDKECRLIQFADGFLQQRLSDGVGIKKPSPPADLNTGNDSHSRPALNCGDRPAYVSSHSFRVQKIQLLLHNGS
jgi:hypothetical protein